MFELKEYLRLAARHGRPPDGLPPDQQILWLRRKAGFFSKHADHDQKTHGRRKAASQDQGRYFAFVSSGGDLILGKPDGRVQAYDNGTPIGGVRFRLVEGEDSIEVHVSEVEVDPAHRRRGVGRIMIEALKKAYPGWEIKPSTSFTREGAAFWASVMGQKVAANPFVRMEKHADHDQSTHGNRSGNRQKLIDVWNELKVFRGGGNPRIDPVETRFDDPTLTYGPFTYFALTPEGARQYGSVSEYEIPDDLNLFEVPVLVDDMLLPDVAVKAGVYDAARAKAKGEWPDSFEIRDAFVEAGYDGIILGTKENWTGYTSSPLPAMIVLWENPLPASARTGRPPMEGTQSAWVDDFISQLDPWNEFPGRRESGTFYADKTKGSGRHVDPNRRVVDRRNPFAGVDEEYEEGDRIHKHAAHDQGDHGNWARRGHILPLLENRSLAAGVSLSSEGGELQILQVIREEGQPKTVFRGSRRKGLEVGSSVTWDRPVLSTSDRRHLAAGFTSKVGDHKTLIAFEDAHALDVSQEVAEASQWEREHLIEGGTWKITKETFEPNENYPNVMYRVLWAERVEGIAKHAAPIHPGTGSNQDPHGSWADGMGGDRDAGTKSKPESQIFGQTTFPGTRIATPDQSFETWMRHVESLEDAPPEGWTPQVLKDALAKMRMEDVTPEFRASVDETLGKVLVEPKIERFRRKYGNATWLTATKTLDGIDAENAGMNGQYLSEAGGQIVVYEHIWTEGEKFLKEDEFNGVYKGFDGDEVRLPIQSGSGMAHVLRHEFGHHIHSEIVSRRQSKKFRDLFYAAMRNIGADGQLMGGTLGKDQGRQYDWYTKDGVGGKFVSTYGMTNEREGFAEVFSAVTHPDYDRSVYDPSLHDLLDLVEGLA